MRAGAFVRRWKSAVEAIKRQPAGKYEPIEIHIDGESFEIGKFSRFEPDFGDEEKLDKYLVTSTKDFSRRTSFFAEHVFSTGIGLIITFRGIPKYIIDPGVRWRSSLATQFGISRTRYAEVARHSRLVERIVASGVERERQKRLTAEQRLFATIEEFEQLKAELAMMDQEVRHLREEVRRHAQD